MTAEKWISVTERLPEDDCAVLVAVWLRLDGTQHLEEARFRRGTGEFVGFAPGVVTHWMPMPLPPAAGSNNGEKG